MKWVKRLFLLSIVVLVVGLVSYYMHSVMLYVDILGKDKVFSEVGLNLHLTSIKYAFKQSTYLFIFFLVMLVAYLSERNRMKKEAMKKKLEEYKNSKRNGSEL